MEKGILHKMADDIDEFVHYEYNKVSTNVGEGAEHAEEDLEYVGNKAVSATTTTLDTTALTINGAFNSLLGHSPDI